MLRSLLCVSPTNTAQDYLFLLLQTARFSDVLLLPTQIWFVSLKPESFRKLKQICTSVLRSTLSNFSLFCGMKDLCGCNTWQMHMREGPHHHMNFMVKASFFGLSGAQCVFCHIWKSQYFHLTSLQLQIKGQVYIYAHSNVLSLELTINSTFDCIYLTILIATLWHYLKHHCHFDTALMYIRIGAKSCFQHRSLKREWQDRQEEYLQSPNTHSTNFPWTHQLQVHEAHHLGFAPSAGSNLYPVGDQNAGLALLIP